MSFWFWHGLRNGIQSTRYPWAPETAPGISPGRPLATGFASAEEASQAAANCPVDAIARRWRSGQSRSQNVRMVPALPLRRAASAPVGREL